MSYFIATRGQAAPYHRQTNKPQKRAAYVRAASTLPDKWAVYESRGASSSPERTQRLPPHDRQLSPRNDPVAVEFITGWIDDTAKGDKFDLWHCEGRLNRVLVVRRQQVTQSVTAWWPLMEGGERTAIAVRMALPKLWGWDRCERWMDLDESHNGEISSLLGSWWEWFFFEEDVTQKHQIINLDCSLCPRHSRMTSRFCKKKSWWKKNGGNFVHRNW